MTMKDLIAVLFLLVSLGAARGQVPGMFQPLLTGTAGPKVLTFQTSDNSTVAGTSFTFSSKAIGPPSADRYVIVGIGGNNGTATISSVTVGGISATQVVTRQVSNSTTGIYIANVPTGTTANIVINWSASQANTEIGIWSATGLSSGTANSSGGSSANNGTITLNTTTQGFALAVMFVNSNATITWTGLTSRFLQNPTVETGGADTSPTSAGTLNVSGSNSDGGASIYNTIAAAW